MIEFQKVNKVYPNGAEALRDINLKVEDGEFLFVIGESGAGKSTLVKLLSCEEKPTDGTVILDNYEVSRIQRRLVPKVRRRIGMIFQDFRLIESKTVFENIAFAMEIVGAKPSEIKQRVSMVLSVVGLRHKAEAYPDELSGGEAQRVGVARAMVNNPRMILADEPTGNLDPANSEAIMALLEEINRAGTTVIACTHDLDLVRQMSKRVIELHDGQIVSDHSAMKSQEGPDLCFLRPQDDVQEIERILEERKQKRKKVQPEQIEDEDLLRRRTNRMSLAERIARLQYGTSEEIADAETYAEEMAYLPKDEFSQESEVDKDEE